MQLLEAERVGTSQWNEGVEQPDCFLFCQVTVTSVNLFLLLVINLAKEEVASWTQLLVLLSAPRSRQKRPWAAKY